MGRVHRARNVSLCHEVAVQQNAKTRTEMHRTCWPGGVQSANSPTTEKSREGDYGCSDPRALPRWHDRDDAR